MSARPKLVANNFASAAVAARTLNTQVLQPLYQRVERLENRAVVVIQVLVANPVSATYPVQIPVAFPARGAHLINAWDLTNNTTARGVDMPNFRFAPDGSLQLVWLGLTSAVLYELTFEVLG